MNNKDDTSSDASAHSSLKKEISNVGRHSVIYMLAPAFSKIIGFLLFPLYTRFLTTDRYGIYSLIDILISFAMIGLSMNIADAMTRFYYGASNETDRREIVSTVFFGVAMCSLPIALLCIYFAPLFVELLRIGDSHLGLVRLAFLAAWFSVLAELGFAYLRLRYRAKAFLVITILQVFLLLSLNILCVAKFQMGIRGILVSTTIVQAVIGSAMLLSVASSTRSKPNIRLFGQFVRYSLPLVPSTAAQQLNNYVHPVMLQWLLPDPLFAAAQVGIFSVGQKIAVVVNRFIVVPLNGYWNPRKMELILQDTKENDFIIGRICTYATLLAASFGLVLSLTVESLFDGLNQAGWVRDPAYMQASRIVPLIALAYVVHSLEHHFATGMHVTKKTKAATWIAFVSLTCVLCTNIVLMPRIGFVAAGLSVLLGVSVRSLLFFISSQKLRPIPFEFGRLSIVFGLAIAIYLTGSMFSTETTFFTFLIRLAFGLLYVPLLWLVGFFDVQENRQILKMLQRIAGWVIKPIRRLTKSFY